MFNLQDARRQRLWRVIVENRHWPLSRYGSAIKLVVYKVHGDAAQPGAGLKYRFMHPQAIHAMPTKSGKQGRMYVQHVP